ncbi:MAG: MTAP family purine nucleoside phosphorylase [Solirubrobacteraceae bacterium]|nr:MTAP family purine nucleoside phosphorylase [Solirubrobacteraceae bacterium]
MRIGIITGSGTYALPGFAAEAAQEVVTEFGPVTLTHGALAGADIVHVSRHLPGHARLSNHVTHQANICALRDAGVDAILAVTVCGAVDPTVPLGTLVAFDDLHFLSNRLPDGSLCTLHTEPGRPGRAHWVYGGPFSPELRAALLHGAAEGGFEIRDGGCYGHVDGPRFNTAAEIRSLASVGVTAVSQTGGPETVLAGEAGVPYALLGYATDYANGVHDEATPVEELVRLIEASKAVLAGTLTAAVAQLVAGPAALPRVGSEIVMG